MTRGEKWFIGIVVAAAVIWYFLPSLWLKLTGGSQLGSGS